VSKGLQDLIGSKVFEPPPFALQREALGEHGAIITITGELDMLTVPALRKAVTEEIESGTQRLLIDLSRVSFIDSVSLAAIVTARRGMRSGGRVAVVIERDSYTMLIFEIGGLDSAVELYHSRADAVARLGA
jgi:anti-anti-sigma factor